MCRSEDLTELVVSRLLPELLLLIRHPDADVLVDAAGAVANLIKDVGGKRIQPITDFGVGKIR